MYCWSLAWRILSTTLLVSEMSSHMLEPTPKKDVLFLIADWNAKVGSQVLPGVTSNTCSNKQVWLWSTKWSRAKANRVFPREWTGISKHSLPTTQEMTLHMDITRCSVPKSDWLHAFFAAEDGEAYTVSIAQIMNFIVQNSDLSWKK